MFEMTKSRRNLLLVFAVVCLSILVILSVFTVITKCDFVDQNVVVDVAVFPLDVDLSGVDVDLSGVVFSVGDKLSGTATITNNCGKNVIVESNGYQPAVWVFNISEERQYIELSPLRTELLRANGKLSKDFMHEFTEPGTYVLCVRYVLKVNGVALSSVFENIIEVKS
jgi:hypothetical protein